MKFLRLLFTPIKITLIFFFVVVLSFNSPGTHTNAQAQTTAEQLRLKWREQLIIDVTPYRSITEIEGRFAGYSARMALLWQQLDKSPTRTVLWPGINNSDPTGVTYEYYQNLRALVTAYYYVGSPLHQNQSVKTEILSALEWLHVNRYNSSTAEQNWWYVEIGIPMALNDILVMMYDEVPAEKRQQYLGAINFWVPNPHREGVNLIWTAKVVFGYGILSNNSQKIVQARDAILPIFSFVTTGDGFYEDGSIKQHYHFASNASYGPALLGELAFFIYTLNGTSYDFSNVQKLNLYSMTKKSFEEILFKGAVPETMKQRSPQGSSYTIGNRIINALIKLAQVAPEPYKSQYKLTIKQSIQSDPTRKFYLESDFWTTIKGIEVVNDAGVNSNTENNILNIYRNMDRILAKTNSYMFNIGMFSTRNQSYEQLLGDNLKGWYTAAGAVYFNTIQDLNYYEEGFWATINPYRLPGTTVLDKSLGDGFGANSFQPNNWVGGASSGTTGITGMILDYNGVYSEKSWALEEGKIIFVGNNIKNKEGSAKLLHIIENRKSDSTPKKIIVDGVEKSTVLGQVATTNTPSWVHVEGTGGYVFLTKPSEVYTLRENRTGKLYGNVLTSTDNESTQKLYTKGYSQIWLDFGNSTTVNNTYAYVFLPNATVAQTQTFAQAPTSSVVSASAGTFATLGNETKAYNFFRSGTLNNISATAPASVLQVKNEFYISDPTHSVGNLTLTLDKDYGGATSKDSNVSVSVLNGKTVLNINTTNTQGKTFSVKFPTASACEKSKGDANCDGKIDLLDFDIWRKEFNQELNTRNADFTGGNGSSDGVVDLLDFEIWRREFTK